MRILFVVNSLGYGGAETQLVALSRELARRGDVVAIYTLQADNPRVGELAGSTVQVVEDQKRHKLDLALLLRIRRFLVDFRPDIVQGFLVDGDLHARLVGAGTGVPVLNSERSDNSEWPLQHRIAALMTRRLAAGLVANTHTGARLAQRRFGLPDSHVHVVWNGIDVNGVQREAAAARNLGEEFFGSSTVNVACLVGMIRPAKDHVLALEVAEALRTLDPSWRVLFVGDCIPQTSEYKAAVLRAARSLIERRVVAFAGLRRDAPALIRAANVLFITSTHEGFPNVVLEAMAVGTPIVTTDYSDIRMILPFDWQVVASRSPIELAEAIVKANRERTPIAVQQREWLCAHATLDVAADRLRYVYKQYLSATRRKLSAVPAGIA